MTEPIIINGVDVSGCEFSTIRSNELKCLADDKDVHTCLGTKEKTKCPIYRLKIQLQNKTAECEELNTKYTEVLNLAKQNADANEYCLQELEKENQKLKQALEEIEKIVTLDKTHIKYAGSTLVICDDILDIIRKAKGEEG